MKVERDNYGAVKSKGNENYRKILTLAIKQGQLEPEYMDIDSKHRGSALNYSVYDFMRGAVLVQKRETTCTKYGNSPKKSYWLLIRQGRKVIVYEAPKKGAIVRKAKKSSNSGEVVRHILGKKFGNNQEIIAKIISSGFLQ